MARNQPIHQIVDHLLAVFVDRCEFNAVAIAFGKVSNAGDLGVDLCCDGAQDRE